MSDDRTVAADAVEVALEAAVAAGEVLLGHLHAGVRTDWKGDRDPVSAADHESQRIITRLVEQAFPGHVVVGEEGPPVPLEHLEGRWRWYVDPLDGTVNFLKRLPYWSVSIGVCDADDRTVAGVVHIPVLRQTYAATLDGGARRDGVRFTRPDVTTLDRAVVAFNHSRHSDSGWGARHELVPRVLAFLTRVLGSRSLGSCSCEMVATASGQLDVYWGGPMSKWDTAAGLLIASEAGAVTLDHELRPATWPATSYLVAAPGLEQAVVELATAG